MNGLKGARLESGRAGRESEIKGVGTLILEVGEERT